MYMLHNVASDLANVSNISDKNIFVIINLTFLF